jgi:dephospho-CoA kinase
MRRVIGLTGSIGSGKSLVAQLLKEKSAIIIDADSISREVMSNGQPAFQKIAELWPETITTSSYYSGSDPKTGASNKSVLDRKALGNIVFNDKKQLQLLETIVHPLIRESVEERIRSIPTDSNLIFYMAPLIFEAQDTPSWIRPIVLVSAPRNILIDRVMARDNCTKTAVELRLQYQLSEEEKRKRADFIIDNSGSIESLKMQVNKLWDSLKKAQKQENEKKIRIC